MSEAGATVEVQDYDGGHGWHGDVWGNIAAGIKWLENSKPSTTVPTTQPAAP